MQSFEDRLAGFLRDDFGLIGTQLLSSIRSFFVPEIEATLKAGSFELFFLGIHAVMQIVGETIFGKTRLTATRYYLENFVDGDTPDTRFSEHAELLHESRNIGAHLWYGRHMHDWKIDLDQPEGCKDVANKLHFNPTVFMDCFLDGFDGGRIWELETLLTEEDWFQRKYRFLAEFLRLGRGDPVRVKIRDLVATPAGADRDHILDEVHHMIEDRFLGPSRSAT